MEWNEAKQKERKIMTTTEINRFLCMCVFACCVCERECNLPQLFIWRRCRWQWRQRRWQESCYCRLRVRTKRYKLLFLSIAFYNHRSETHESWLRVYKYISGQQMSLKKLRTIDFNRSVIGTWRHIVYAICSAYYAHTRMRVCERSLIIRDAMQHSDLNIGFIHRWLWTIWLNTEAKLRVANKDFKFFFFG